MSALPLIASMMLSSTPPLPTFATEFALDYRVSNYQYGFVTIGRWTVDHKDSTGSLNLRERTDSYNASLQPRAEIKDFGNHVDYKEFDKKGYPPCMQGPLNGTQKQWTIDPSAKLITVPGVSGAEVWRTFNPTIHVCVDFYIRGAYPKRDSLPYQLLYQGNCTGAGSGAPVAGEILAQNNSYTNFSLTDNPPSLFKPTGACPPAPPPPPPPPPVKPWEPATDCKPACDPSDSVCCKDPETGQDTGVCFGWSGHPVTNCSEVGVEAVSLVGKAKRVVSAEVKRRLLRLRGV